MIERVIEFFQVIIETSKRLRYYPSIYRKCVVVIICIFEYRDPFFNLFYACRTSRPSAIEERPRYLFIRTAPITFRLPNHAHFFKLTSRLKETLQNVRNLSVLSSLETVQKTWRITVFLVFGLFFFL